MQLKMHVEMASSTRMPTTQATGMTICLLSLIHELISLATEAPTQLPLLHLPPPSQVVPSRKFCCMV
jgi:hypothetical protein